MLIIWIVECLYVLILGRILHMNIYLRMRLIRIRILIILDIHHDRSFEMRFNIICHIFIQYKLSLFVRRHIMKYLLRSIYGLTHLDEVIILNIG